MLEKKDNNEKVLKKITLSYPILLVLLGQTTKEVSEIFPKSFDFINATCI